MHIRPTAVFSASFATCVYVYMRAGGEEVDMYARCVRACVYVCVDKYIFFWGGGKEFW